MTVADIILPLAVEGLLTYRIPDNSATPPVEGLRVLVQLGKKKIVTGIIRNVRTMTNQEVEQSGIEYKEIYCFLEAYPIVTAQQLQLWEWISAYYMCSIGEVMRAALPTALKLESETQVLKNPDFIAVDSLQSSLEAILELLSEKKPISIDELARRRDVKSVATHVNTLLEMGAVIVQENVKERFTRKRKRAAESDEQLPAGPAHPLTEEQEKAVAAIHQCWQKTPTVLLHGVTSSGKTEVYIHLIQEQLEQGKQVLYLVPEIALTTQLTSRLRAVFGSRLGVYHSRLSDRERVEMYKHILAGDAYDVVIGVRSSLFLPFTKLGLIIVDEEHDASYKQQDPSPRYHARTTALMLASLFQGKTLLGTATPAVESYYNAQSGRYGLVEMTNRFAGLSLPSIHLLDLKKAYKRKEITGHFSDPLVFHIREQLEAGKQVMLFQNHRGYNAYIECRECGYIPKCVHCDVSLTEHKAIAPNLPGRLVCHYCGYSIPTPVVCPQCGKDDLKDRGFGTERIEEEVKALFPEANVARMDTDTTQTKHAHEKLIHRVEQHDVDILVGTQMITKGLHFKDVNLVAVMNADSVLNMPDFRAQERGYQLLEQVSGRAGRHEDVGHVIIQTADPTNPVYQFVKKHDYQAMYDSQLEQRKLFKYPPFHRLIRIALRHREASRLETAARTLCERLQRVFGERCSNIIIPAISRAQNMYVRELIIKIEATAPYAKAKEMIAAEIRYVSSLPNCKSISITPDVDPM